MSKPVNGRGGGGKGQQGRGRGAGGGTGVNEDMRIKFTKQLMALRDDTVTEVNFPSTLTNIERKFLHQLSDELGLRSKSYGVGADRHIIVSKRTQDKANNKTGEASNIIDIQLSEESKKLLTEISHLNEAKIDKYAHSSRAVDIADLSIDERSAATPLSVDLPRLQHSYRDAQLKRLSHPNYASMEIRRRSLPANHYKSAVCSMIKSHNIVLVSGETGCGKTTQVPQFLLDDEEIGPYSRIIVTQPRRLSAISVAERVAKERGESIGNIIGYNIRMEHNYSSKTQCLFVTPGVLLRKIISDPTLLEYSHVIIDEAHERDRFTEFLIIVLRDIVERRPCLRLVLMSATLHTDKISSYFGGVPHVHMGGSMFPVQEFFLEHVLQYTNYNQLAATSAASAGADALLYIQEQQRKSLLSCPLCKSKSLQFRSAAELATHVALCTGTVQQHSHVLQVVQQQQQQQQQQGRSHFHSASSSTAAITAGTDSLSATTASSVGSSSLKTLQSLVSSLRSSSKQSPAAIATTTSITVITTNKEQQLEIIDSEDVTVIFEGDNSNNNEGDGEVEDFIDEHIEATFTSPKHAIVSRGTSASSTTSISSAATATAATAAATPATWANDFDGSNALLQQYQSQWDDSYVDYDLINALLVYVFDSEFCKDEGGVLIFLPGWEDISNMYKMLDSSERFGNSSVYKVLQLHSGIPRIEQDEVFKPLQKGQHKIILSTNIAETSITIDDISVVIDSGKLKERIYDPHIKLSYLKTNWISRASARQRVGRAGRTRSGVCFHLFSKTRCLGLDPFQESELLRMPLEELVLQTKSLSLAPGCGDELDSASSFLAKALDPPHPLAVSNAIQLLMDIGCLTDMEELTVTGKAISNLPMDPRLGRAVLIGCVFGCGQSLLTVATAMGYRDPFVLPSNNQMREQCNFIKSQLSEGIPSDQICLLKSIENYNIFAKHIGSYKGNFHKLNRYCDEHFLSRTTMNALIEMTQQLTRTMNDINIDMNSYLIQRHNGNMRLVCSLLGISLYPNIAIRKINASSFSTQKGPKAKLHASSVNSKASRFKNPCKDPIEVMGFDNLIAVTMGVKSNPGAANLSMTNTTPVSIVGLMLACGSLREVPPEDIAVVLEEVADDDDDDEREGGKQEERDLTKAVVDIDSWIRVRLDRTIFEALLGCRAVIAKAIQQLVSNSDNVFGHQQQSASSASGVQLSKELLTCLNMLSQVLINEMPMTVPIAPTEVYVPLMHKPNRKPSTATAAAAPVAHDRGDGAAAGGGVAGSMGRGGRGHQTSSGAGGTPYVGGRGRGRMGGGGGSGGRGRG